MPQEIAAPVSKDSSSGSGTSVRAGHLHVAGMAAVAGDAVDLGDALDAQLRPAGRGSACRRRSRGSDGPSRAGRPAPAARATPAPTAATTPQGSCPAITGPPLRLKPSAAARRRRRGRICRSLPHMPEALISSTTSPGPGAGSGNSRISTRRSPANTTPFMLPAPSILSARQCTPREGKRPTVTADRPNRCEGLQRRLAHLGELLVADAQLVQAALLCRDDGAVDLAAIEEDRGEDVEEDERQHRGR